MWSGSNNTCIPNGLKSTKAPYVAKVLERKRWSQAEARAAELIAQIQSNHTSEAQRNAVVSYLRGLITKTVPCKVFTFGSVPLKTYLPDGDIDLTVFGDNQLSEDRLIKDVRNILENEGKNKNKNAEFHVKEVQFIQAEVKIIKCLIDNFVVDISFNQIGGLGTLCFLEEVDSFIKRNHLFKKSIILVKAWCYYESRILGSHNGFLSTYGLEVLITHLFNAYSNTFVGPLEVLFRFLEFFSKFDWSKYCFSLRGPVPIKSLPNMKSDPPRPYARKNCPELCLSEKFLDACESSYGVKLSAQEMKDKPFICKHLNIVDPLRGNNNLGRSISMSNFSRIKSAIGFGAKRIERLLTCPEDIIIAEFDLFFKNTWDRNGKGYWIDVVIYNRHLRNNDNNLHRMLGTSDVFAANRGQSPMYNSSNEARDMHHHHHHHNTGFSSENRQSLGQISDGWRRSEYAIDQENGFHADEAMLRQQKEFGFPNFNEYQQAAAVNVNLSHASFPPRVPFLKSFSEPFDHHQRRMAANMGSSSGAVTTTINQKWVAREKRNPPDKSFMSPFYNNNNNHDLLDGDFETHYGNLEYGRFCKDPKSKEAVIPSATLAMAMHSREIFPWQRKPIKENSHSPVRVMPPRLPPPFNELLGFWLPRFSDGTGTFLPKPSDAYYQPQFWRKTRYQQDRSTENQNRIYERKDCDGEREQDWFLNSEANFPRLGHKFENPASYESSHRGESSHSGTRKVPNFGTGRDSKSFFAQQSPWSKKT